MAGGVPIQAGALAGGFLRGKALIFPLSLVISLFFLWGFSYGLLDGEFPQTFCGNPTPVSNPEAAGLIL